MKINYKKLFFCVFMYSFWLVVLIAFATLGENKRKAQREQYLRESFSPMSENREIIEAFKKVEFKK